MKILVVCGAGASSTFVALRVRRAATDRGLQVEVRPTSDAGMEVLLPGIDVLLVGPHLKNRFEAISVSAAANSVVAVLLTEVMVTSSQGDSALDAAIAALSNAA